jgi:polar amino acid transport system permease protein
LSINFISFFDDIIYILGGINVTLKLLTGGMFIGLIGGIFISILRYMKIGVFILNSFVSILRGTPLILQISFVYFTAPAIFDTKLSIISSGILTFGLNSSAYIAEILRAAIDNLPKGQFEASASLQIPKYFMWKDIILPQIIRNSLPSLINEIISLLKETALIGIIGGLDIMRMSQMLAAEKFTYFLPLCIAGSYYYFMVLFISFIGKYIEKRMIYVKN